LAEVLRVAAAAWLRLRGGQSLDRALEAAAGDVHEAPRAPGARGSRRAATSSTAAPDDRSRGAAKSRAAPDEGSRGAATSSHAAAGSPSAPENPIAAVAAPPARLAAAAKDVAYTATRHLAAIDQLIALLAARPPDPPVAALLAVSLAQLLAPRHAPYAVVDQAVTAAKADPATRAASGFVNAMLRRYLREQAALTERVQASDLARYNVPAWWLARVRRAYPAHWAALLDAQREAPPLVLRVNAARVSVEEQLQRLQAAELPAQRVGPQAIWLLTPRPVSEIPGFAEGAVSVQDAGAQLAARWLDVRPRQRVLDACAAPGGKTGHLAELASGVDGGLDSVTIDALESDRSRAARIDENLARLQLSGRVRVIVGDAAAPAAWHDGALYDRILLDAPCTASGIVRRHPDIPWLRRANDVAQLATLQARMLDALWPLVAPAGRLLYVVCSLFPEEGTQQVERFLARRADARLLTLPGATQTLQLLPTPVAAAAEWNGGELPAVHDGFFYALFEKS
jgi:16S rRNA (cytosine967-C5)-methyltransferase